MDNHQQDALSERCHLLHKAAGRFKAIMDRDLNISPIDWSIMNKTKRDLQNLMRQRDGYSEAIYVYRVHKSVTDLKPDLDHVAQMINVFSQAVADTEAAYIQLQKLRDAEAARHVEITQEYLLNTHRYDTAQHEILVQGSGVQDWQWKLFLQGRICDLGNFGARKFVTDATFEALRDALDNRKAQEKKVENGEKESLLMAAGGIPELQWRMLRLGQKLRAATLRADVDEFHGREAFRLRLQPLLEWQFIDCKEGEACMHRTTKRSSPAAGAKVPVGQPVSQPQPRPRVCGYGQFRAVAGGVAAPVDGNLVTNENLAPANRNLGINGNFAVNGSMAVNGNLATHTNLVANGNIVGDASCSVDGHFPLGGFAPGGCLPVDVDFSLDGGLHINMDFSFLDRAAHQPMAQPDNGVAPAIDQPMAQPDDDATLENDMEIYPAMQYFLNRNSFQSPS